MGGGGGGGVCVGVKGGMGTPSKWVFTLLYVLFFMFENGLPLLCPTLPLTHCENVAIFFLKEINVFIIIACYLKLQDLNNVLQISDPTFNAKNKDIHIHGYSYIHLLLVLFFMCLKMVVRLVLPGGALTFEKGRGVRPKI